MNCKITFNEDPSDDDLQALQKGYAEFTEPQLGKEGRRDIAFFVRDARGCVIGGVSGCYSNYGWLWIGLLWVSAEIRGKGYGLKLMANIEDEARKNGCTNAYLNSFSFQAVDFYKKMGYRVFGELKDFPPGHSVRSLTKKLV